MGNLFSKRKNKVTGERITGDVTVRATEDDANAFDSTPSAKMSEYRQIISQVELKNLEKMRQDLKDNPMAFVLNNLVLSIQFFDNYDRDKEVVQKKKMEQELEVSKALNDPRKKCNYLGALVEVVGQRYRYKSTKTNYPEVFPSMKYVVVHENFEAYSEEMFSSLSTKEYTTVDERIYRVCMEDLTAENLPGYFRLLAVDYPGKNIQDDSCSGSTVYEKIDYESSDGYSKFSDCEQTKRLSLHNSSSSSNSESSTKEEPPQQQQQDTSNSIADRPPMKTPDPSDSESDDSMEVFKDKVRNQNMEKMNSGINKPIMHSISECPLDEASEESEIDSNASAGGRRGSGIVGPKSLANFHQRKVIEKFNKEDVSSQDDANGDAMKSSKSMPESNDRSSSSGDEYDYTCLNGPKKLKPRRKGGRNPSIPSDCFKSLKKRVKLKEGSDPLGIGDTFVYRTYLSSQAFFEYFSDTFHEWGNKVVSLQEATTYKSSICCSETRNTSDATDTQSTHRVTKEFVPALPVHEWPAIAQEWPDRKRKFVTDPRTQITYTWPYPEKIQSITKKSCYLLPDGGKARGRFSLQKNFQWQLAFCNAEESLLSTLSHSHLRCLLWAQLIFCHVLAPLKILSPHHVTTVFFWMVESNYVDFEEASLGERIAMLFNKLYSRLRRRHLPHYFVRSRNLLDSKRPEEILKVQEKVYRLLEEFVPLVIQAALQIDSFNTLFPFPDLDNLWDILTSKSSLAIINPDLFKESRLSAAVSDYERPVEKSKKKHSSDDCTQELLRNKRAHIQAKEREKMEGLKTKESKMNEKFKMPLRKLDETRKMLLLTFFIKHFIEMARMANRNRADEMSIVFLSQAANLAVLLDETGYCKEAQEYSKTIEELRLDSIPSQFKEEVVNIPGSPFVFATGVRPTPEGHHFETRARAEIPLPKKPVSREVNKISNGHVPRGNEPTEESFVQSTSSSMNSLKPQINHVTKHRVAATIENHYHSSTDSDYGTENSLQLPSMSSRSFVPQTDSEDESTDF